MWRWTTCESGDLSEREIEDFNAKSSINQPDLSEGDTT